MARHGIKSLLKSLGQVVFPDVCIACVKEMPVNDVPFCVSCLTEIPFTSHFEDGNNHLLAQKFWGKVDIEDCASLMYFTKDSLVQNMVHRLKYLGKSNVGRELGKYTGSKIVDSSFNDVDFIIPIPLHYKKEQQRGYNQAKVFGDGVSEILQKPLLDNVLFKIINNKSQTDKGREHRYQNVLDSFVVKNENLIRSKHILIVDDVITTGATIEACAQKLQNAVDFDIQLSVISIAMA